MGNCAGYCNGKGDADESTTGQYKNFSTKDLQYKDDGFEK
jgi:hypothetical protein